MTLSFVYFIWKIDMKNNLDKTRLIWTKLVLDLSKNYIYFQTE